MEPAENISVETFFFFSSFCDVSQGKILDTDEDVLLRERGKLKRKIQVAVTKLFPLLFKFNLFFSSGVKKPSLCRNVFFHRPGFSPSFSAVDTFLITLHSIPLLLSTNVSIPSPSQYKRKRRKNTAMHAKRGTYREKRGIHKRGSPSLSAPSIEQYRKQKALLTLPGASFVALAQSTTVQKSFFFFFPLVN